MQLVQNKFPHITKLFQDQEEELFSSVSMLVQLLQSQEWEDGNTTIGLEQWSGIMNIWSLFISVMLS